jgi:hypothetical protein
MPTRVYKCPLCDFQDEYIESFSVTKENFHPDVCPTCNEGRLEEVFDLGKHRNFQWNCACYENTLGTHNWKQGKSDVEISKYLTPDPETGHYKEPY